MVARRNASIFPRHSTIHRSSGLSAKPCAVTQELFGEPKFRELEPDCQLVASFHGVARRGLTLRGKTPQATPCHGASAEAHALTHAILSAVNDP